MVTVQYHAYGIQETKAITSNWHDVTAMVVDVNAKLIPGHIKAMNNRGDLLKV